MRKFVCGAVVATMFVVPSNAGATVVPNATYGGTFTTGTPGATVEVVVSADGSLVDFASAGWGNNGDCASNSLGRDDMSITDDGFSFFDGGPPLVSLSGFFGDPGVVSGTAQISGVCNSGTQSWTAETPVVWPDGFLEHAFLGFAGENVYNTTGTDQAISQTVRQGRVGRFLVHVENDGTEPDAIDVRGCDSSRGFKVKYTQGGENISSLVKAGTYQTATVDTGESETLKLQIKAAKKAKPRKKKACRVSMSHSGTFRGPSSFARTDAVIARVKVKRG